VQESARIKGSIWAVWRALKPMSFDYLDYVTKAEVEEKKTSDEVGAVVRLHYADESKTVQRIQITEISEHKKQLSWTLLSSVPSVAIKGAEHTIRLLKDTVEGSTFMQWTTQYASGVTAAQLQDAKFKQRDHFIALNKWCAPKGKLDLFADVLNGCHAYANKLNGASVKSPASLGAQAKKVFGEWTEQNSSMCAQLWDKYDTDKNGLLEKQEINALVIDALTVQRDRIPVWLKAVVPGLLENDPSIKQLVAQGVDKKQLEAQLESMATELTKNAVKGLSEYIACPLFLVAEIWRKLDVNDDRCVTRDEFMKHFITEFNLVLFQKKLG
jgi:hypothetical protein